MNANMCITSIFRRIMVLGFILSLLKSVCKAVASLRPQSSFFVSVEGSK